MEFAKRRFARLTIQIALALILCFLLSPAASAAIKTQAAADSIQNGIRGIDVSKWQGTIDWKKVSKDNVKFVFCRATYGTEADATFVTNAKGAHANGLYVGAYHYARFTSQKTMQAEAKAFLAQLKKVNITYPVVLDLEQKPAKMTRSQLTSLANQFADILKKQGYTVLIYSYNNFFREHLSASELQHDLWVANYLEEPGYNQVIWQHTSEGKIDGINGNVDINIAYKNLATKKKVTVNKEASDNIRATLAKHYGFNMPEKLDSTIYTFIRIAVQMEVNRQWDVNLAVDGKTMRPALEHLAEVQFTSSTKGNITYLIQAELFYRGYYKTAPTSKFDDATRQALAAYQKAKGLPANGEMTEDTLFILLG